MSHAMPAVNTFSIVARDPATGDLGVAVESRFLAVGAVVPWARAGVGALATQAHTDTRNGPTGLAMLERGATAQDVLDRLVADDATPGARQLGAVDNAGRAASYTGPDCSYWAGSATGDGFCCQGNILTGPEVVDAMVEGYTTAVGTFAHRLLTALDAGQAAGGDSRGQQSAALLIVREGGGYGGGNDRWIDLRVDDHPTPIAELRRLVLLHRVYFDIDESDVVPFDELRLRFVAGRLNQLGLLPASATERKLVEAALRSWAGRENLEERLRTDGQLDSVVLEWLARAN